MLVPVHLCLDLQIRHRIASNLDWILEAVFDTILDRGDRLGTQEGFHDVCQYWTDWRFGISEAIRVRFVVLWFRGDDFEYGKCSGKIGAV